MKWISPFYRTMFHTTPPHHTTPQLSKNGVKYKKN